MSRPWLVQTEAEYLEKGGWEELADFEKWIFDKLEDDEQEIYDDLNPVFQTKLYSIFCDLADSKDCALYVDYKKSCEALKQRDKELSK